MMIVDAPLAYLFIVVIVEILAWVHHYTIDILQTRVVLPSFEMIARHWPYVAAYCVIWLLLKLVHYVYKARQIGSGNARRASIATVPRLWQVVHRFIHSVVEFISPERIEQGIVRIQTSLSGGRRG